MVLAHAHAQEDEIRKQMDQLKDVNRDKSHASSKNKEALRLKQKVINEKNMEIETLGKEL